MNNPNTDNPQHDVDEIKLLFKHLLIFLVVVMIMKFWNMAIFPTFSWSGVIMLVWTVILGIHLLLFFLSTGVLGKEYENVPVREIARRLFNTIKDRNASFRKSITRKSNDITNP